MFSPELVDSARIYTANINVSSSGDNTIVSAQSGKQIRVISFLLVCASAVNVSWKSGASTTKSGPLPFAANGGVCALDSLVGHFTCDASDALVLNLGSAVQVGGHVNYQIIG